jgi:hypothetical protein
MKIMFNGLDRLFELLNLRYGREAQEIWCSIEHPSLSLSLSLYIYIYYKKNENKRVIETPGYLRATEVVGSCSLHVFLLL